MPTPKLLSLVTVFMLAVGTSGAYAAYTLSDLQVIEQYLLENNVAALSAYVEANPGLLDGDDQLATALRQFTTSSTSTIGATQLQESQTISGLISSY
jgi:hypothetical protein